MSKAAVSNAVYQSSALFHAVQLALNANDPGVAKRVCEDHLRSAPDDPDAHRYLGHVLVLLGEHDQARTLATRATELAPQDPRTWSDLGRVHVLARKIRDAIPCFEQAVALAPDYADGWHNLGVALKQAGQPERAFEAVRQALLLDPTRADSYLVLGNLLVEHDQLDEALVCFERAVTHDPQRASAPARLAQELSQRGDVERARALLQRSIALDPKDVDNWVDLGRTLEDLGQAEGALSCYRAVLRKQPGHAFVLGQYLALAKDDEGLEWLEQVEQVLDRSGDSKEGKALIGYGLAKFYDRRGAYKEAAHAATRANAARRRATGPLDREGLRARIDAIMGTYTPEFLSERRQMGLGTDQPVFIVGLPRSGTTLTEQILSAHPLMYGAGELPDLARLARQAVAENEVSPWQAALRLDDAMASRRLAHEYLCALRRQAPPDCPRISDKQPLNFFHLAFAALLFPNARVIHCRRDARDNALSIWIENFNPDQRYATDFDDLAFFIAQERRLMAHWNSVLPLSVLTIQYEDVVADLEGQARRLIAFLGVPWDDCCLNFHQQDRAVQTPSRWQVRQPIYTNSVGRWRRYRDYLPDLERAFETLPPER